MNFCAWCKKDNPQYKCGHCLKVWYCNKDCQSKHAPYHLRGKSETQRLIIPSGMDLILPNTHYHDAGGGIMPYSAKSVRMLIEKTGGNVKEFDNLLSLFIESKKKFFKMYINQPKLGLGESDFDEKQSKWIQESYNLISTLINPLCSSQHFKVYEKDLLHIKNYIDNPDININDKKKLIDVLFQKMINDETYISYLHDRAFVMCFLSVGKTEYEEISNGYDFLRKILELFIIATTQISMKYKLNNTVSFDSNTTKQGLKMSIIPKGTFLYRGFGSDRSGIGLSSSRKHDYFGFDYKTTVYYQTSRQVLSFASDWVKQGSGFSVFTTKKDQLRVLDLTDVNTVKIIHKMMLKDGKQEIHDSFSRNWKIIDNKESIELNLQDKETLNLLRQLVLRNGNLDIKDFSLNNWSIEKNTPTIKRVSGSGAGDDVTVNWLCANGFDGYIGYGFELSDELVLCDPRSVLKLELKKTHVDDFFIDLKLDPDSFQGEALINYY